MVNEHMPELMFLGDQNRKVFKEIISHLEKMTLDQAMRTIEEVENFKDGSLMLSGYSQWKSSMVKEFTENRAGLEIYRSMVEKYVSSDVKCTSYWNDDYPVRLRSIPEAPICIYSIGNGSLKTDALGLTGTRNPSKDGSEEAYNVARLFSINGINVVSGLAKGIDTAGHRGAIEGGGSTTAVLGTDIQTIYPAENKTLARHILGKGCIVSEITSMATMHQARFLNRNRIISGLSKMIIAIETGPEGGTIGQLETALKQGRPCFILEQERYEKDEHRLGFRKAVDIGARPIKSAEEAFECFKRIGMEN